MVCFWLSPNVQNNSLILISFNVIRHAQNQEMSLSYLVRQPTWWIRVGNRPNRVEHWSLSIHWNLWLGKVRNIAVNWLERSDVEFHNSSPMIASYFISESVASCRMTIEMFATVTAFVMYHSRIPIQISFPDMPLYCTLLSVLSSNGTVLTLLGRCELQGFTNTTCPNTLVCTWQWVQLHATYGLPIPAHFVWSILGARWRVIRWSFFTSKLAATVRRAWVWKDWITIFQEQDRHLQFFGNRHSGSALGRCMRWLRLLPSVPRLQNIPLAQRSAWASFVRPASVCAQRAVYQSRSPQKRLHWKAALEESHLNTPSVVLVTCWELIEGSTAVSKSLLWMLQSLGHPCALKRKARLTGDGVYCPICGWDPKTNVVFAQCSAPLGDQSDFGDTRAAGVVRTGAETQRNRHL